MMPGPASADSPNATRAVDFLTRAASGDVDAAFRLHVAEDFVHHNPWFPPDREALRAAMAQSATGEPNKSFAVQAVIEEGDRVAVFSRLERAAVNTTYAVVHIVRFNAEGLIAELWDIVQEQPAGSPNTLGMF